MTKSSIILAASALILSIESPAFADTNDPDILDDDVSIVLTQTRLRQSLADVPGSVTVITADMLAKFGVRSIPEALRLVPGMIVTQVSGNDYRINYHGTNIYSPRRMNVLIDGMSVYLSAFARVDWTALPVAIEDIQRIEVTRGPNSASYGPNSMLAIINIITKHPQAVEGTTLSATGGTRGTANGMVRHAGKIGDATSYRMTLEHQQNRGFNSVAIPTTGQTAGLDHDSSHIDKFNFRSITDLSKRDTLDLQVALLSGSQDALGVDSFNRNFFPDVWLNEYDVNAIWRRTISANEELKVQAYLSQHNNDQSWTECLPTLAFLPQVGALWRANPNYMRTIISGGTPSGGTPTDNALAIAARQAIRALGPRALMPTCGNVNQNYRERRADLEVQDTYVFSNALRMVGGLGVRRDLADSMTYLNGTVGNTTWRAFTNIEYKPVTSVSMNIGGYYEHDTLTGSSFSPRFALNKHIDGNNTVRFVVSRANRMPDIFEQRANWSYLLTNLTPPLNGATEAYYAQSARALGNLNAEKILSKEIGYTGNFPQYALMLDAKVFDDHLTNLISERLILNNFSSTNTGDVRLRGAEIQVDYEPAERWMMHIGYSHVNNDASNPLEKTQYAKNSGSIAVTHLLQNGWRGSLALYAYQAAPLGQSAYGKQDLTFSKTYRLGKDVSVTPTFTVTHLDHRAIQYFYDIDRSAKNSYSSSMQYYLTVKLTF